MSVQFDTLQLPPTSIERVGRVVNAFGTSIRVSGLPAQVGSRVVIQNRNRSNTRPLYADVVGVDNHELLLYPLGKIDGVDTDSEVSIVEHGHQIDFSDELLGCVVDGVGNILDGKAPSTVQSILPVDADAPDALTRKPIDQAFATGIRAIDSLITVGRGQRMGIFAPAGAGKSTLLNSLASNAHTDVSVIALIGERGREVAEFINKNIDTATRQKTVIVVATSDKPAMERVLAARFATAVAEGFRNQGKNVLLLMDSVTRYARALRDIGLSVGETPVRMGYPPSVFADLPRLFERAGNNDKGTITAFYTVLMEDEDNVDPVAEETRSILDGHIVLTRKLAECGHYPAIDVLASTSRLFNSIADAAQLEAATRLRQLMARYNEIEFLVQVGEYQKGADITADLAVERHAEIDTFLRQSESNCYPMNATLTQLSTLVEERQ